MEPDLRMNLCPEGASRPGYSAESRRSHRAHSSLSKGLLGQRHVLSLCRLAAAVVCVALIGGCGGSGTRHEGKEDATRTVAPIATPSPTAGTTPTPKPSATAVPTEPAPRTSTATRPAFPTSTPAACGVGHPCTPDQFCELPSGVCATDLDSGSCVAVQNLCPDAYAPVCGCDGLTYGNDCLRRGARARKALEGPCDRVECQDDCDCYASRTFALPCPLECASCDSFWTCQEGRCFEHCGFVPPDLCRVRCSSNDDCVTDASCQKPTGHCDGRGACRRRPEACPGVIYPVCGCDGHTHNNNCEREWARASLAHGGACAHPSVGFVSVHVVNGPSRQPVADVDVSITGSDQVSKTDRDGIAAFEIPPGNYFVDARVCCAGPGFIDYHVPITVETGKTVPVELEACLECICASPDTPIATPDGETPMHALAVGDLVYSIADGQIVAVPILETNHVAVHAHHVVRLTLATGAVLEISPGHPTADGRTLGDLRAGDRLAGVEILAAELVPYAYDHTFDILPASDSGVYFAGGIPLGSTLHHGAALGDP